MADPYRSRLISAREEEDERRPDPASTAARAFALNIPGLDALRNMVGGRFTLEDVPGVRGIQQTIENAPKENALLSALYGVTRPGAGVMGGLAAALRGEDALQGAQRGFTGEETVTGADVLAQQGVGELGRLQLGPLDISGRDVAGFGLDVAADPLNLVTLGGGTLVKAAGKEAMERALAQGATRTAAEAAKAAAETAAKKSSKWGGVTLAPPLTRTTKPVVAFDPLSAVAHGLDVATSSVPPLKEARQWMQDAIGDIFQSNYRIKKFAPAVREAAERIGTQEGKPDLVKAAAEGGAPELASELRKLGHQRSRFRTEALEVADAVARRLQPLDSAQQDTAFKIIDGQLDMTAAQGDNAIEDLVRWWQGEYEPTYRALGADLGLRTFLPDYIKHTYDDLDDMLRRLGYSRGADGAIKPVRQRSIRWQKRTGGQDYQQDILTSVVAQQLDLAAKRHIKATNDFVQDALDRFGVKLGDKDIATEGFAEFLPKGPHQFFQAKTVPQRVQSEISATGTANITEDDLKGILAVGKPQRWALPEPVADTLNRLRDPQKALPVIKLLDTVQGLWKASVYSIWPASHVRNMYGDTFLNLQAGVSDPRHYVDAIATYKARKRGWKAAAPETATDTSPFAIGTDGKRVAVGTADSVPVHEFMDTLQDNGLIRAGYSGEELLGSSAVDPVTKGLNKINLIHKMQEAAADREDTWRIAHVLGRLNLGDNLEESMLSAKRYLFDYSDLSDAEKNIRRFVPFMTWTRRNVPLQLEKLAQEPRQAAMVSRIVEAMDQEDSLAPEDKVLLGDYYLERLGVVLGKDEEGMPKILSGIGLPIEDIRQLWAASPERTRDQWMGMVAPLYAYWPQTMFNYSFFSGKTIDSPSYQNPYSQTYALAAGIPGLRDWLEIKETKITSKDGSERTLYDANPERMFLLLSIMSRFYYTAGKATDPRKEWGDHLLNTLTGMKIGTADVERAAVRSSRPEFTRREARILDERYSRLNDEADKVLGARSEVEGQLQRKQYRRERSDIMQETRDAINALQAEYVSEQAEMDPQKVAAIEKYLPTVDRAMRDYYAIVPEASEFADPLGNPDMRKFFAARDQFLDSLPPNVKTQVRAKQLEYIKRLPPAAAKIETEYQSALESYKAYQSLPPFAAPVSASDLDRMRWLNQLYMAYDGPAERGKFMAGLPGEDRALLGRYFAIKQYRSPQRRQYETKHPEIRLWGFVD